MYSGKAEKGFQQFVVFSEILEKDPHRARQILKKQPLLGTILTQLLSEDIKQIDETAKNIPRLLHRYLNPLNPRSTFLCLGTGTGKELVQVRKVVPEGRIIAIDNNPDLKIIRNSVINEFRAKAEFYPIDLDLMSPKQLIYQLGGMPDVVLCRHPQVYDYPAWIRILANWGQVVAATSNQLLITTFQDDLERQPLLGGLAAEGISPIVDTWPHGDIIQTKSGASLSDRYVLGINVNK